MNRGAKPDEIDLRGVACPESWARAKVRLEQLERFDVLSVLLDDERGARDLPRAAEAEGYEVLEVATAARGWRIVIQK